MLLNRTFLGAGGVGLRGLAACFAGVKAVCARSEAVFRRPVKIVFLLLSICLLGCAGGHRPAPVFDRYNPAEKPPPYYIVSAGDTLFSIAWRYGFDVQRLANANNISPPYVIYPGQAVQLKERYEAPSRQPVKSKATAVARPVEKKSVPPKVPSRSAKVAAVAGDERWRWPIKGPLLRGFVATGQAHKGIDIGGKMGEPVRASRGGVVVYAGSGLVGYGNLLILKHSERYLSAYGHNRLLLVKEGDSINAGDKIAELGDSGTDSAKLHFEVRIDGKPVDPLKLLRR